ncbi:hypothetical protein B0H14DRAFT_2555275 [Mycena olivaceomarginata]|nr:hypothetical protein B0H14DRAFT_2555275 [Mycena olivaceomarginata]
MCSFININTLAMAAVALTVLCLAPLKVNADIIMYTTDKCQGVASVNFLCNGICQSFANGCLFRVDVPGNHCMTVFRDTLRLSVLKLTGTPQQSFTYVANTNCNN